MGRTNGGMPCQVDISGVGSINGVSFKANGTGSGDASTGSWDFSVTFSVIPQGVDPFANLLGILILPTIIFGREDGDARNLLTLANGDVEFTQTARGDELAVQSAGTIRTIGSQRLNWHSEAEGEIRVAELGSAETFDAVMLPQGKGKIIDLFALPFISEKSRRIVHVIRNVTFSPRTELSQLQFRRITIRRSVNGQTVKVSTVSIIRAVSEPLSSQIGG